MVLSKPLDTPPEIHHPLADHLNFLHSFQYLYLLGHPTLHGLSKSQKSKKKTKNSSGSALADPQKSESAKQHRPHGPIVDLLPSFVPPLRPPGQCFLALNKPWMGPQ
jgi:hypothetical protein